MLNILVLIIGFVILIKGADIFVDGASSLASNFKVPKILIGLTIVAFGTSAPEFAVSVKSMLSNSGDIVLGNVIGSNIFNTLLIIGISGLVYPLLVKKDTVRKEIPMISLISLIFAVLVSDNVFEKNVVNTFSRSDGIVIVLVFSVFLYYLFSIAFKDRGIKGRGEPKYKMGLSILFTILGIGAIILGSNLVVEEATLLAKNIGVSEKVIALTVIAFGTSLPELVTSVVAAFKHETDLAIGNIVGSNIFNIAIVLGIPTMIFGGISAVSFSYVDLGVMLASSVLLWLLTFRDYKIAKIESIILLAIFVIYYAYVLI